MPTKKTMKIDNDYDDLEVWALDNTTMGEMPDPMDDLEVPRDYEWIYRFLKPFYWVTFNLGLLSNSWMIYYLLKFSKLHIVPKMYLVNRALLDLFFMARLPISVQRIGHVNWNFGTFGCGLYYGVLESQPIAPALFLMATFLDILLVQCFPTDAKKWRTPRKGMFVSLIVWFLLGIYLAPIVAHTGVFHFEDTFCGVFWDFGSSWNLTTSTLYRLVFGCVIPLAIVAVVTVFLHRTRTQRVIDSEKPEEQTELQKYYNGVDNNVNEFSEPNQSISKPNFQVLSSSDVLCWKLVNVMPWLLFLPWISYWLTEIYRFISRTHGIDMEVYVFSCFVVCFIPVINPLIVIFVCSNINLRQFLHMIFSYFEKFLLRCRQLQAVNRIARRIRWNSWRPLYNPTTLEDVRIAEH